MLASLVISLWLARTIATPAVRLAEAARRRATGTLNQRVEESGARELRQMGHAFNEMADQLETAQADREAQNGLLSAQARNLERASAMEHTLGDALRAFTSSYQQDAILSVLLSVLAERHGFLVGAIYRYDEWAGEFVVAARYGTASDVQERVGLRDGIIGQAILDRRVVVVGPEASLTMNTGLVSVPAPVTVVVPVFYQDRIMGAMALAHTAPPDEAVRGFLNQLGQQLGIALQNLDQYTNLQRLSNQLQTRQEEIEYKNRELERADKMKSEFLANMSHELRTPLNAIIGFSELLQDEFYGPVNADQDEYLGNIYTAGEHLLGLINDILDLSKIEAGRMELDLEEIDLPSALESSLAILKEKAHDRGVRLAADAGDVTMIIADARKLKQILFNLLSNAVKFTPAGGSVTVTAHREGPQGEMAVIAVADTGVGISAEDQQKLFREFTQVDGSLARRHEGTGLGLALTKRLVELHGGAIAVTSAPGEGSTFTIRLPLAPDSGNRGVGKSSSKEGDWVATLPDTPTPRHPDSSPLILVIEDDDATADLIVAYLESAGYRTARACNGHEGLEMARGMRPDGITLDVMMPVMDGWTFLEEVGADPTLSAIPVIVLSLASDLSHGFSLGASAVLGKPVRRDELCQALVNARLVPRPNAPIRVLVVDEDSRAVDLVADYLASFGYHVSRAYSGAHGIELAEREHPDLVILDLMMPEVNGFMVVEHLRAHARTADIPIIILTAKIVSAEERQRLNGHIVAVAEKSGINRAAFLTEVERAVRQPETVAGRLRDGPRADAKSG